MALELTNKKRPQLGTASGSLYSGAGSGGTPQSLDGGTASYGRLSRPSLAVSSGRSFSGALLPGTPRVTSGATAYAGADPASVQLDTFRKTGPSSSGQSIDRLNNAISSQAQFSLQKANTTKAPLEWSPSDSDLQLNQITSAIDDYNQRYNSYMNSSQLQNGVLQFTDSNGEIVPGTEHMHGTWRNGDESALRESYSRMASLLGGYNAPDDASPEFKEYIKYVSSQVSDRQYTPQQYQEKLTQLGVMAPRFNPANSPLVRSEFGTTGLGNTNNYPTNKNPQSSFNFPELGNFSGRVGAITDPTRGTGYTSSMAAYNPWVDGVYNNAAGAFLNQFSDPFVENEYPYAPYIYSGYGGRFAQGSGTGRPQTFANRDLSRETVSAPTDQLDAGGSGVVEWNQFNYLGDAPESVLGRGQREVFNNNAYAPANYFSKQMNNRAQGSGFGGSPQVGIRRANNTAPNSPYQYGSSAPATPTSQQPPATVPEYDTRTVNAVVNALNRYVGDPNLSETYSFSPEEADNYYDLARSGRLSATTRTEAYSRAPQQLVTNYVKPTLQGGPTVSLGNQYAGMPTIRYQGTIVPQGGFPDATSGNPSGTPHPIGAFDAYDKTYYPFSRWSGELNESGGNLTDKTGESPSVYMAYSRLGQLNYGYS